MRLTRLCSVASLGAMVKHIRGQSLPRPGDTVGVCTYCGKPFTVYRLWQRFCSPPCSTKYHYEARKKNTQHKTESLKGRTFRFRSK